MGNKRLLVIVALVLTIVSLGGWVMPIAYPTLPVAVLCLCVAQLL